MAAGDEFALPIRLALVTTELRPGGAERCLTNLALGLNRAQFLPRVYALSPAPPTNEAQLVDALRDARVPVHFIGVTHSTQIVEAVRKLRALLQQQSPDIVQSFLFHANVVSALATHRMRVPVFAGLRVAQPEMLRRFVERRLARRFAGFVCVSQAVADHAANLGRLPREKLHVIPNGIDVGERTNAAPIDWEQLGVSPSQRVILFVGRLDAQKGVDVLIAAASQFFPQLPQHDLVVIGEGAERSNLISDVERRQLRLRIHFAGWRADVPSCIAAAELIVLPSRYEGMSNVLLEAMAAGKPVVAMSVEGVAEVLGPLAEQQTCPPNDALALAQAIEKLASNPAMQQQLGEANRARVAAHFSLRQMIDAYAALYLRTLDRPHAAHQPLHHDR